MYKQRRPLKIKPGQVIGLLAGVVALVVLMRITNTWDTTEYYHDPAAATTITDAEAARTVYICNDRKARLYHYYRDCEELAKCTETQKELTLLEAEDMGRTECGKCKD